MLFSSGNNYFDEKEKMIKQYIKDNIVIFPCNLNKTPAYKCWNSLIPAISKKIYISENPINDEIIVNSTTLDYSSDDFTKRINQKIIRNKRQCINAGDY